MHVKDKLCSHMDNLIDDLQVRISKMSSAHVNKETEGVPGKGRVH